jgi:hypothetical protein
MFVNHCLLSRHAEVQQSGAVEREGVWVRREEGESGFPVTQTSTQQAGSGGLR